MPPTPPNDAVLTRRRLDDSPSTGNPADPDDARAIAAGAADPGPRTLVTAIGATVLAVLAVAVLAVMQTGADAPEVVVAATDAVGGPDDAAGPVPVVGAPRGSVTTAPSTTTSPTTVVDPPSPTTTPVVSPPTTTRMAGPGPAASLAVTTTLGPAAGVVPDPTVVTTSPPPPTAPPPTQPPTTPYVARFGEVELGYAPDGVSIVATNASPSIPTGGRAYWTNHTPLADLELIVNGSSYGTLPQHRSTRIEFAQPGTFVWSIATHPELTGVIIVG